MSPPRLATGRPLLLLVSDPVPVPVRGAEVLVTYDLGAVQNLETDSVFKATLGEDLRRRDTLNVRARREAVRTFAAAYPTLDDRSGVGEDHLAPCITPEDYAAFDAAQTAYETARLALDAEADALAREVDLAIIRACVVAVTGKDVPDPPEPDIPDTWAAWPLAVIHWVATEGRKVALAQVRGKKSG